VIESDFAADFVFASVTFAIKQEMPFVFGEPPSFFAPPIEHDI
jgi:hypothetical protein